MAGIWYLAGSNTCVYSNPRGELGNTQHVVQTSNLRFRDDEFLIPRALTRGRDSHSSPGEVHARGNPALSRPPTAGTGLERNPLHSVLVRDAVAGLAYD
ncbi:MAG: hypothetical protein ACREUU_03090 [Gammaproteobacteria bacterium]